MIIRPAHERDFENMWEIFHSVIQSGDTYVFAPDTPRQVAHEYFLGSDVKSWVADENVRDLLRTIFGASRSRRGHRELALDASFVSQRSTLVLAWNKFQKLWNRPSSCRGKVAPSAFVMQGEVGHDMRPETARL